MHKQRFAESATRHPKKLDQVQALLRLRGRHASLDQMTENLGRVIGRSTPKRRRPQFRKSLRHGLNRFYEFLGHGRAHVEHFQSLGVYSGFLEKQFGVFDHLAGPQVALQKMAFPFHTTGHEHRISAVAERLQKEDRFNSAGAEQLHDPDVVRILKPHGSG